MKNKCNLLFIKHLYLFRKIGIDIARLEHYIHERIKTEVKRKNLSDGIIQHLFEKKDRKDDLEGITLYIYEKELKNLSNEIIDVLNDLIAGNLIVENEDSGGRKFYLISDNQVVIPNSLL